ncbi:hypothetical protein K432DRAFT_280862, partial [Lepidopterella palustris CBS 459.81]
TLGVIIKPDLLERGVNRGYLTLARNKYKEFKLKIGYYILKNRSYIEKDFLATKRDKAKRIFF